MIQGLIAARSSIALTTTGFEDCLQIDSRSFLPVMPFILHHIHYSTKVKTQEVKLKIYLACKYDTRCNKGFLTDRRLKKASLNYPEGVCLQEKIAEFKKIPRRVYTFHGDCTVQVS